MSATAARPTTSGRPNKGNWRPRNDAKAGPKPEPKILFQKFFKSVGTRTYAAQVKEAGNGNHFIVLTEGRRDEKTGEVRKTRVLIFSEDFEQFFKLVAETTKFVREHPVPPDVAKRQQKYWQK